MTLNGTQVKELRMISIQTVIRAWEYILLIILNLTSWNFSLHSLELLVW